ncbi:dihydropteroate synthase-like protein [Ferroglobus sp.]|uniref:dihydropteroate synthase-like protein n=1 Tax=Ferroglobus sp. TaxID=2614230 RepID=UPI0025C41820|nr:dihydropteroate synthase-like protein [Ferroglobus sp.]
MKVLVVTGKLAESLVREVVDCDVLVLDIDIAAFITPSHLRNYDLSDYDLVLVPGLTAGNDWKKLEVEKGVKIRLGPIHAYDLKYVLERVEEIELSHEIPACRLIESIKAEEVKRAVDEIDDFAFEVNGVKIGGSTRMKVVAEVVDATKLSGEELTRRIEHYLESGADIIDLGIPLEFEVEEVRRAVKVAKDLCDVVSIDTFSIRAIKAGIEAGADMIMSLSTENLKALEFIKNEVVVVVDRNVERLKKLVELARTRTERVVADPILDFPGVVDSIFRYKKYRELDSKTPLLFGAGNVTELIDADSIGVNALLAQIAEEVGASLIFTTEASDKTAGAVKEMKIATYMTKGAKLRKTPPKDLGFSLLVLKEKRKLPEGEFPKDFTKAEESRKFVRDPLGDFRIWISNGKIVCSHEKLTVVGEKAKEIVDTVLKENLVSRLDHAAYLGRELKKAEIALQLGKNYVQDEELIFGIYSNSLKYRK